MTLRLSIFDLHHADIKKLVAEDRNFTIEEGTELYTFYYRKRPGSDRTSKSLYLTKRSSGKRYDKYVGIYKKLNSQILLAKLQELKRAIAADKLVQAQVHIKETLSDQEVIRLQQQRILELEQQLTEARKQQHTTTLQK